MAHFRFSYKRLLKRFASYIFWMTLKFVAKNSFRLLKGAFNLVNSFDSLSPDLFEIRSGATSTPHVHKTKKTPARVKETLSSIKRHNRRSNDADFEGKARRELFRTSPGKFLLENDRFKKLPKKKNPINHEIPLRQRLRI